MTTSPRRDLRVIAIPAFRDNYLWLIQDGVHAAVVDPGDGPAVLAALAKHGLTLTAILLTHHHADHIGGVPTLLAHAAVPVFGPRGEAIAAVTHPLGEGARVDVPGLDLSLTVLDIPGHTAGHIAYLHAPWLFCGDTLFGAGCGRLFEGTPAQMLHSLARLAALPDDTLVYCAHEYTLANLGFALAAEPDSDAIATRQQADSARRARSEPTVPSTIGLEKATNPFLRHEQPAVRANLIALGKMPADGSALDSFTALRTWKNTF